MLKILNKTRKVSGKMSVPKQIMTTFFALLFGGGMGIVAKFLDLNRLPSFLDWLDLSNFLGRTAPWIFIAVCLAVFSKSPLKAGINVFAFFVGMLIGYYVWTSVFAGFYPDIPYLMRWLILAVVSPFLAFLIWYARGRGALAIGIIAALAAKNDNLDARLVLLLKVGICGGFTTFSTFSLETAQLLKSGSTAIAILYAVCSVVVCVAAAFLPQAVIK